LLPIYCTLTGEKEPAAHICDELSTLLRYANAGDEYISLLEEFYVLRQYVGIMQARFPGKIEEEDYFDEVYVPRMLLQPLVENAIQHGLNGAGKVRVSAEKKGEGTKVYLHLPADASPAGQTF